MTDEEIEQIALANGFKRKRQPDGSMALNPYVLDFARALLASASQDIPEGWKLLPVELTAGNGMKAALMGEFHVPLPERDENGNDYIRKINVPWTVIKKIHQAVVANAPPPPPCPHPADDKLRKAAEKIMAYWDKGTINMDRIGYLFENLRDTLEQKAKE